MPNDLKHYGVKGMRWGVRRSERNLTKVKSKRTQTEDDKRKASMRKDVKNRRTMSTNELRNKIERLKMQKQLKDLTDEELSPGKSFVKKVLSNSGQKVATTVVTGATLYAIKAAMSKEFNIKTMAEYMTPKPKNK